MKTLEFKENAMICICFVSSNCLEHLSKFGSEFYSDSANSRYVLLDVFLNALCLCFFFERDRERGRDWLQCLLWIAGIKPKFPPSMYTEIRYSIAKTRHTNKNKFTLYFHKRKKIQKPNPVWFTPKCKEYKTFLRVLV